MSYSNFTFARAKKEFSLSTVEDEPFFSSSIAHIELNPYFVANLKDDIQLATAINTEKARSEYIIAPILAEVRRQAHKRISLFSGYQFDVDAEKGLTGLCDFILSKSAEQLTLEAPVFLLVEAKKADLSVGLGQVVVEMVAAQMFNKANKEDITTIYGCVTSGTVWRFLKLEETKLTIEPDDIYVYPLEELIGFLMGVLV